MTTIQQIVEELKELSEVELDVLLEIIQLKKSLRQSADALVALSNAHHKANMPNSLINKEHV